MDTFELVQPSTTTIEKVKGSSDYSHCPSGRPGATQAVKEETGQRKGTEINSHL